MLAGCDSAQKLHVKDYLLQSLGYDCLVSRYSTECEERLTRKELQIKVACRILLEKERRELFFKATIVKRMRGVSLFPYYETVQNI